MAEGSWQDVLARFNPMIQRVFEHWTAIAGIADANALSDKALTAARGFKQVFKGLDVRGTGMLEEELMTYNLMPIRKVSGNHLGAAYRVADRHAVDSHGALRRRAF